MKMIEQGWEFVDEPNPLKKIELAGRLCYKSEDKIADGTAAAFFRRALKVGHYSIIEHATFAFNVHGSEFNGLKASVPCQDLAFISESWKPATRTLVSGNLRAWRELYQKHPYNYLLGSIVETIRLDCPTLVEDIPIAECRPLISHPSIETDEERLLHIYPTVRIVTNRGVTHELVRHRRNIAFSQESTRYCDYGGCDMAFIRPVWELSDVPCEGWQTSPKKMFTDALVDSQSYYESLRKMGWPPQQAREVLDNALKTEIMVTTNLMEWGHIFDLRGSTKAHPQMMTLMRPVLAGFHEAFSGLFDDLAEKYLQ